jgi:hypothetical protein
MRVMPTLDDERELIVAEAETGFSDTFFQCSLDGENGKSYFVSMGFSKFATDKGTRWHTRFEINEASISQASPWKIPLFNAIRTGTVPEVDIVKEYEDELAELSYGEDKAVAKLPGITYVSHVDQWDFKYEQESGSGFDLHFNALSRPFWFADGGEGQWTKSSKIKGFEAWSEAEGTLFFKGSPVKVRGLGAVERVKLTAMVWREVNWYDWIWVISDQLYLLLFHVNNGGYLDGKIYLPESDEYLNVESVTIEYPQVSYIPDLNHFVSTKIRVTATTVKGVLFLDGKLRRMHKRDPYQDLEFNWEGQFSFWNGDKLYLTNAKGADEQGAFYSVA